MKQGRNRTMIDAPAVTIPDLTRRPRPWRPLVTLAWTLSLLANAATILCWTCSSSPPPAPPVVLVQPVAVPVPTPVVPPQSLVPVEPPVRRVVIEVVVTRPEPETPRVVPVAARPPEPVPYHTLTLIQGDTVQRVPFYRR